MRFSNQRLRFDASSGHMTREQHEAKRSERNQYRMGPARNIKMKKQRRDQYDSHPSLARYRFRVPVSTLTLFTLSLVASSLLTASTMKSFLPSSRIPPFCIKGAQRRRSEGVTRAAAVPRSPSPPYLRFLLRGCYASLRRLFGLKLGKGDTWRRAKGRVTWTVRDRR